MAGEYKHFSHVHGLVFEAAVAGVQCSGCRSPAVPGGNMYGCRNCNYFLHDHCFRAARSVNHPSHPTHPLTLLAYPTYPSGSFFCNSCGMAGNGFCYCCSNCDFDLHVHCASHHHHSSIRVHNHHLHPPPTSI